MTSRRVPLAALLATLFLAPAALAHGSVTGSVRQGEVDLHQDDHASTFCAMVITTWTVSLAYAPASDTLTLVVAGQGVSVGRNGAASVSFTTPSSCATLDIAVHGTVVAASADYTLSVASGHGGGVDA